MHPGLLDVLHDPGDLAALAVAERVDVDLDRVLEEPVEQQRVLLVGLHMALEVLAETLGRVADLHRPAAEHVGGADQEREADVLGDHRRLLGRVGGAVGRVGDLEPAQQGAEAPPVLGQVDRVDRRPEQGDARVLETYVSYLRKKLDAHGPPLIHTVRGVGYALRRPRS